jgi:hypothetical protein
MNGTCKIYGTTMKRPNQWIIGIEEGEEIQTKGTDNVFNRIIAENTPNLEKERVNIKSSRPKQEHPQTHNQNTWHTEQRKHSERCKREKTGHI